MSRPAVLRLLLPWIGLLAIACSDDGPQEVTLAARAPEGLTVRGTVYGSTLAATRGRPLAGVTVRLSGAAGEAGATRTDALGGYRFVDLAEGSYRLIAELAGYQRAFSDSVALLPGVADLPDGTTLTVDLDLRSNPVLLDVEPAPGLTLAPGPLTLALAFSEPLAPTSVRAELLLLDAGQESGARLLAVDTVWESAGATLTVTPRSPLPASAAFELRLVGLPVARDLEGFPLDLTGAGGGLTEASFAFATSAGGLPGAPVAVTASLANLTPEALDWPTLLNLAGGAAAAAVELRWAEPLSGPLPDGYRVYGAAGDGPLLRLAELGPATSWSVELGVLSRTLFGGDGVLDPVEEGNVPTVNGALQLQVAAFDRDGEGPTATATLVDAVPPALVWAGRSSPGADLPPLVEGATFYLGLSEPVRLDGGAAQAFRITGPGGATVPLGEVRSVWRSGRQTLGEARMAEVLQLTLVGAPPAGELTVQGLGGVRDLAGNAMVAADPRASYGPFAW